VYFPVTAHGWPAVNVSIKATDGKATATGRIGFIAPTGQDNQGLLARVTLDNQESLDTGASGL
jgi:hypothetical protein